MSSWGSSDDIGWVKTGQGGRGDSALAVAHDSPSLLPRVAVTLCQRLVAKLVAVGAEGLGNALKDKGSH